MKIKIAKEWVERAAEREAEADCNITAGIPDDEKIAALETQNKTMLSALEGIEPHLDAIICYASTTEEHEPNRLAANVRAAIKAARP